MRQMVAQHPGRKAAGGAGRRLRRRSPVGAGSGSWMGAVAGILPAGHLAGRTRWVGAWAARRRSPVAACQGVPWAAASPAGPVEDHRTGTPVVVCRAAAASRTARRKEAAPSEAFRMAVPSVASRSLVVAAVTDVAARPRYSKQFNRLRGEGLQCKKAKETTGPAPHLAPAVASPAAACRGAPAVACPAAVACWGGTPAAAFPAVASPAAVQPADPAQRVRRPRLQEARGRGRR